MATAALEHTFASQTLLHLGHGGFLGHAALVGFHLGCGRWILLGQLGQGRGLVLLACDFKLAVQSGRALRLGLHLLGRDVGDGFDLFQLFLADGRVTSLLLVGEKALAQNAEGRRDAVEF